MRQALASRALSSGCTTQAGSQRLLLAPQQRALRPQRACFLAPQAIFGGKKQAAKKPVALQRETVVPEPSFNVPLGLAAIAGVAAYEDITPLAFIAGILSVFLAFQATRVKFLFRANDLEVVIAQKPEEETENAFVGGANRWSYDSFVNWEFWWKDFPVLVYFKETQTKPEGQIHFFPIIFNGKQLYNVMVERCGTSQNSGPKA